MKIFYENLKIVAVSVLILTATFSVSVEAQKRKADVSKKAQIRKLTEQGLKQIQAQQPEAALETFTKCIALKPVLQDAEKCYFGRGTALFLLEKYEESIPDFTAVYKSGLDFNAVYMRGRAHFEMQNFEEAFKDFSFVINMVEPVKIKQRFPEIYGYRGATYTARKEYDEAIEDYTKAIELLPQSADFYYARAIAFELKGELESTKQDLRKALELDAGIEPLVNEILERIERIEKSPVEKKVTIEKSDAAETEDVSSLEILADKYFDASDYLNAIETYTKILTIQPDNAKIYYRRGTSYGNQSQYESAIADYSKAVELDPKNAKAYLSRGMTLQELGKNEDAIKDLSRSIELYPDESFGYVFRAKAYCKTGKKEAAKTDEEKAKKLGGYIFEPCQ